MDFTNYFNLETGFEVAKEIWLCDLPGKTFTREGSASSDLSPCIRFPWTRYEKQLLKDAFGPKIKPSTLYNNNGVW